MTPAWEEATALPAVLAALKRAARGAGSSPEVALWWMDAEPRCLALGRALRRRPGEVGAWSPSPGRTFPIFDPKPRRITVIPFGDRVAHHVIIGGVEAELEGHAVAGSYACRKGFGTSAALRRVRHLVRRRPWALTADVASFFASIPRERLLEVARAVVSVPEAMAWLERVVRSAPGARGLPIGALTSQHLANLFLGVIDHEVGRRWPEVAWVRYMDDMRAFGSREPLVEVRGALPELLGGLGLTLKVGSVGLRPTRQGVAFLGWRVMPTATRLGRPRKERLRRRWRGLCRAVARGQLSASELAPRAASLFAWLRQGDTVGLRRRLLTPQPGGARPALTPESGGGGSRFGLQPGQPRRQLELHPGRGTPRQPQEEAPVQRQRQPGVSSCELGASPPAVAGSRTGGLCTSADPGSIPSSGGGLRRGADTGAEHQPGLHGDVGAGLLRGRSR